MRKSTYVFWACGHTSYEPITASHNLTIMSIQPTVKNPSSPPHKSQISASLCSSCLKIPIPTNIPDPYLKNFAAISRLLSQSLDSLAHSRTKSTTRARHAVSLLARMSRIYRACTTSKPGQHEMRQHIQCAIRRVEAARRHESKRSPQPVATRVCRYEQRPQFSQGTVEWQLGGLTPYAPYVPVSIHEYTSEAASYAQDRFAPQSCAGYTLPYPELLGSQSETGSPGGTSASLDVFEARDTRSSMQIGTPALVPASLRKDLGSRRLSMSVSVSPRAPPVTSYLDGRDNWACDFCGPECFCWGLAD